MSLGVSN